MRLKRRVLEEVGLPITVGIATTKFLAKVASAVAKPDGLLEVPAGGELAFLHPLPVERLWGVGPVTAGKLNAHGVVTVAQVARLSENALVSLLGRAAGRQLHALSHNRDPRRVRVGRRRSSIGAQCAIGWRPKSWATVDATLVGLVDRLGRRLRAGHRVGRTVMLRLRFDDFSRATRSYTLPEPTAETRTILTTARGLLAAATPLIEAKGLTLVGVTLGNLEPDDAQLLLPGERRRAGALDAAVDDVRDASERMPSRARSCSGAGASRSRCCPTWSDGTVRAMDYKLELVAVPVSDVDRAKAFYTDQAGFNADHDHQVSDELRFIQLTPPGSACSISLGSGLVTTPPGSLQGLQLVVDDIEAAHAELSGRGVEVSDIQDFPWGSFVFFSDPDGNGWAVQQIQPRG